MKDKLIMAVDRHRDRILEAERRIWKNPETGYREWKTNAFLTEQFEELGYTLNQAGNIPGFFTDIDTGRPGPTVCVMGELDSLICFDHPECDPETGAVHACGHNAQCAGLLGVAAALKEPGVLDQMSGRIRLMAVPAEELIELEFRKGLRDEGVIHYLGGKVEFLYRGYLEGVDMVFMLHTSGHEKGIYISGGGNGCITKHIEFEGRAVHASSPSGGINALYAANLGMNAINALRETFIDGEHTRVHPIITNGGTVVNAIPSLVSMESYVRGASIDGIKRENKKVNRALAASAAAMGAQVHLVDLPGYCPLHNDRILSDIAEKAFGEALGADVIRRDNGWSFGCTDMGDISAVMPAIQPYVGGSTGTGHGKDYYIADPEVACVDAAKAQVVLLWHLLKDDAAEAVRVKTNSSPIYKSYSDYFKAIDSLWLDCRAVEYSEEGIMLRV